MTILIALVLFTLALQKTQVHAQTYKRDAIILDAYYGGPNLYRTFLNASYLGSNHSYLTSNISGVGLIGLRAEKLLTRKLGIAINANFATAGVYYTRGTFSYDEDFNTYQEVHNYDINIFKIATLVSLNYHFLKSKKFDYYFSFGIGYKYSRYTFESSEPDFSLLSIRGLLPIALKIGTGFRYYVLDNIGVNFSVTAGHGGILNGGLSYRF